MATLVFFDETATPQRVLNVRRLADPAPFRTATDVVITPDLSALEGIVLEKYWKHVTGTIVEMTTAEQTAQDAAEAAKAAAQEAQRLVNIRAEAAAAFDGFEAGPLKDRAFADIIKQEFNILRALHGLPDRTLAQLRTAIKNRTNDGTVDS